MRARLVEEVAAGRAPRRCAESRSAPGTSMASPSRRADSASRACVQSMPYQSARRGVWFPGRATVVVSTGVDDDGQIMRAAAAGDRAALAAFVRDTQDHVWRYCGYLGRGDGRRGSCAGDLRAGVARAAAIRGPDVGTRVAAVDRAAGVRGLGARRAAPARVGGALGGSNAGPPAMSETVTLELLLAGLAPERREAFVLTQIGRAAVRGGRRGVSCPDRHGAFAGRARPGGAAAVVAGGTGRLRVAARGSVVAAAAVVVGGRRSRPAAGVVVVVAVAVEGRGGVRDRDGSARHRRARGAGPAGGVRPRRAARGFPSTRAPGSWSSSPRA